MSVARCTANQQPLLEAVWKPRYCRASYLTFPLKCVLVHAIKWFTARVWASNQAILVLIPAGIALANTSAPSKGNHSVHKWRWLPTHREEKKLHIHLNGSTLLCPLPGPWSLRLLELPGTLGAWRPLKLRCNVHGNGYRCSLHVRLFRRIWYWQRAYVEFWADVQDLSTGHLLYLLWILTSPLYDCSV